MSAESAQLTRDEQLAACERVLEYQFRDRALLNRCLTHSSAASTRLESNERLEFLGDAVLGLVVCENLFQRFPTYPEGELTRLKSVLVSRETCALLARELNLDRYLDLGKGLPTGANVPASIMAAVTESLTAGLFLDGGLSVARDFLTRILEPEITRVVEGRSTNHKSVLQQLTQREAGETPNYLLLDEQGPDHSKCFKIAAMIGAETYPAAWGPNKKEAEQRAAANALSRLEGTELPHPAE